MALLLGLIVQISTHFEGLVGKRVRIKGESAEYSLEVVKYDKGSKGEQVCNTAARTQPYTVRKQCRGSCL